MKDSSARSVHSKMIIINLCNETSFSRPEWQDNLGNDFSELLNQVRPSHSEAADILADSGEDQGKLWIKPSKSFYEGLSTIDHLKDISYWLAESVELSGQAIKSWASNWTWLLLVIINNSHKKQQYWFFDPDEEILSQNIAASVFKML